MRKVCTKNEKSMVLIFSAGLWEVKKIINSVLVNFL